MSRDSIDDYKIDKLPEDYKDTDVIKMGKFEQAMGGDISQIEEHLSQS